MQKITVIPISGYFKQSNENNKILHFQDKIMLYFDQFCFNKYIKYHISNHYIKNVQNKKKVPNFGDMNKMGAFSQHCHRCLVPVLGISRL